MKRCPRCGLVHPDSETICRRCRVDLSSGEKVEVPVIKSRAEFSFSFPLAGFTQFLSRLSELRGKITLLPRVAQKEKKIIYCLECGGMLKVVKEELYPRKFSYPLLGLALVLLSLSWLIPSLLITGILSLAGFFSYTFLVKRSYWQCRECGARKEK